MQFKSKLCINYVKFCVGENIEINLNGMYRGESVNARNLHKREINNWYCKEDLVIYVCQEWTRVFKKSFDISYSNKIESPKNFHDW